MKHDIVLKGYGAFMPTTPSKMLCLGTAESYGIEQLNIIPGAGWEGLVVKATFHPASSEPVVVVVGENGGVIDVPPEATAKATAESSPGVIVFSGVADGTQRISANLAYTVIGHAPVEGKDSEPTPSQWEQLAAAYQRKVDKQQGAENAGKVLSVGEDGNVTYAKKMDLNNPSGNGAFSMNRQANTAVGGYSSTLGAHNTASGVASHAEGYNTIAASSRQHVQGQYNISDPDGKYLHIVGNGKSDSSRSNAHTIDKNGLGWFAGGLKVGGTGQDDETSKEVALKDDIPTIPDKLPNPNALKFVGAVSGEYDGSAPVKINIPKPADVPEKLPNPKALVFEGAVEATYDGSDVVRVNIPKAEVDEGAILDILVALEIAPVILDGDGSILADPTGAIIVNH